MLLRCAPAKGGFPARSPLAPPLFLFEIAALWAIASLNLLVTNLGPPLGSFMTAVCYFKKELAEFLAEFILMKEESMGM